MKTILITALVVLCAMNLQAQEQYTVDGKSYELNTEVSGTLTLLWNIIDREHRYFVKKDGVIVELVNTKNDRGKFNEEYKTTLKEFTSDAIMDLDEAKFLLFSLKDFVNAYNLSLDDDYAYNSDRISIKKRLGFFGGISNNPFVTNPDNEISPFINAELEFYDTKLAKRHGAFLGLRHIFKNSKLNYTATEVSMGYRYRFVLKETFNIYTNIKLAAFTASKGNITYLDEMDMPVTEERSATNFDAPVIFGLAADIKVGENGFLTLSFDELFALFFDNNDNFPTVFSTGYKFKL